MPTNTVSDYQIDACIAEIYDQQETYDDDVMLLYQLIAPQKMLRILEPFCGTGRILLPLARAGHTLVGLDRAAPMLDRARQKLAMLSLDVQQRVTLQQTDVLKSAWPEAFDVVILGGNAFYELATAEEQVGCIAQAARVLAPGGYVYVDNNHMEGDLDPAWRSPKIGRAFPSGTCADGTQIEATTQTIWYDAPQRLVRFHRTVEITRPDGRVTKRTYVQQKHPPSQGEVAAWLAENGFVVRACYGDRSGSPYTADALRAIFWAEKQQD